MDGDKLLVSSDRNGHDSEPYAISNQAFVECTQFYINISMLFRRNRSRSSIGNSGLNFPCTRRKFTLYSSKWSSEGVGQNWCISVDINNCQNQAKSIHVVIFESVLFAYLVVHKGQVIFPRRFFLIFSEQVLHIMNRLHLPPPFGDTDTFPGNLFVVTEAELLSRSKTSSNTISEIVEVGAEGAKQEQMKESRLDDEEMELSTSSESELDAGRHSW